MISAAQVGRQIFTKNGEDCRVDVTQVVPIDATQADSRWIILVVKILNEALYEF